MVWRARHAFTQYKRYLASRMKDLGVYVMR